MNKNMLRLVQSLDSLFPIGGYTLSNGMETYVQKGIVKNEETLLLFLKSYMYMLQFNELAFAAKAYKGKNIKELDMLLSAYRGTRELREASMKQGIRFLKLHTELSKYPRLEEYMQSIRQHECDGHYCVAMGIFLAENDIDLYEGLELYCYNIISAMTNHAVKLVPLRQLDGQRALFNAAEDIEKIVKKAIVCPDFDLGSGGCGFDIRSMQHEKLYSRLYIS